MKSSAITVAPSIEAGSKAYFRYKLYQKSLLMEVQEDNLEIFYEEILTLILNTTPAFPLFWDMYSLVLSDPGQAK